MYALFFTNTRSKSTDKRISQLAIIGLLSALFFATGCSSEKLIGLDKRVRGTTVASKGDFCVREDILRLQKVIFVVDKSGSNTRNDPDDVRRADNIQRFITEHRDDPNFRWSFVAFGVQNNTAVSYMPPDGNGETVRFGNADEVQMALDTHRDEPDIGCTPYIEAIEMAEQAIRNDKRDFPDENSVYNVFFMSDGFPRGGMDCELEFIEDDINNQFVQSVLEIKSLQSNSIFFNTAYYATPAEDPDRTAARGLEILARHGGGNFSDLQANNVLNFNDLLVGPQPEAYRIKRLGVYNLSSGFCDDGTIDVDSDGDGLCDRDEIQYNTTFRDRLDQLVLPDFDPLNRYSLDENYSDLFAFQQLVLPTGTGLPACDSEQPGDEDFDLMNDCEERVLLSTSPKGPTNPWTNSLQTLGGTTLPNNPDSDGDGILDIIEYFMFKDESSALNYENLFQRYDGNLTGESLVWFHRHPLAPSNSQSDYDITFYESGTDPTGSHCYYFEQKHLPLYPTMAVTEENVQNPRLVHGAGGNSVLFYYIAVPRNNPHSTGILFHSVQELNYGSTDTASGIDTSLVQRYDVPDFIGE